jgi:hypothetical protein
MRAALGLALILAGCIRPADDRFDLDGEVGAGVADDINLEVVDGQAQVLSVEDGVIRLWAQSPAVRLVATNSAAADRTVEIVVDNVPEAAAVTAADGRIRVLAPPRRIARRFEVEIGAAETATLDIAAADAGDVRPFRFAVLGDVQTALDRFDEVLAAVGDVEGLEFIMSTGDLVEDGQDAEWELLDAQLETATLPFYSTIGNHELVRDPETWHRRFGRYNVHFIYRDVAFSFVDSGNSTFDPDLRDQLRAWLDESRDRVHLIGTHYPLIDPIGGRNASFRSRKEASSVLVELAEGRVDATFYGHIHSYYAFSNAGIPAFISGGGGAWPERLDGIGRHFLVVDVDPQRQLVEVGLVRID